MKNAQISSISFKWLDSHIILMYEIKDVRSYVYKLFPTINDEKILTLKENYYKKKAMSTTEFKDFSLEHAYRYENQYKLMLKDPDSYDLISNHPHELRLLAREAKKARNIIFKHKNALGDALYYLKRRLNYYKRVECKVPNGKTSVLLSWFKEDLETIQTVAQFLIDLSVIEPHEIEKIIDFHHDELTKLESVVIRFHELFPTMESMMKVLTSHAWKIKRLQTRIKKNKTRIPVPKELKQYKKIISRKIDHLFFISKRMVNHFILTNFNRETIHQLRNGTSPTGYKYNTHAEFRVLYQKLRKGFPSSVKTVLILHDKLGTPSNMNDRLIRNALVLASNVLKSQDQRLRLMDHVHEIVKENLTELHAGLNEDKHPRKIFKNCADSRYFFVQNVWRAYKNNVIAFLKIQRASEIDCITEGEVRVYFEKVFDRVFHQCMDLFLAHPLNHRSLSQLVKSRPLFKVARDNITVNPAPLKVIEKELNAINLDKFLKGVNHVRLDPKERDTFERFLRWCLTASFLVNVVKTRDQENNFSITPSLLAKFKASEYLQEVPMMTQDTLLFHGDDSKRMHDPEWNAPKVSGNTSEVLNVLQHPTKEFKIRLKLMEEDGSWTFHEFHATTPELEWWFSFNEHLKECFKKVLLRVGCKQVKGYFLLTEPETIELDQVLEDQFSSDTWKSENRFQVHLIKQVKAFILERWEEHVINPTLQTRSKFYKTLVEDLDAQTLHELLREDLKTLTCADFGPTVREFMDELNPEDRPLDQVNVMKLKRVFSTHLEECPEVIREKFKLVKLKNYIMLKKHLIYMKKNKLYMSVPIQLSIPTKKIETEKIVGCDWGIRTDLSCAIFDYEQLLFEDTLQLDYKDTWEKIMASRQEVARLQRVRAAHEKGCLQEGQINRDLSFTITCHGLKNQERLKKLAHGLSRSVVDWCVDHDAMILALESLKSLKLEHGELSRVLNHRINYSPRSLLKQLIEMKLRRFGGKCYSINPASTSQYSSMLILQALKQNGDTTTWFHDTTKGIRTNDPVTLSPQKGGEYFHHDDAPLINADINASKNLCLKLYHKFN